MSIFIIVLLYGITKLIDLESKNNPNVSFFIKEGHFNQGKQINLTERDFRIAFAVEGYYTEDLKYDPRFVKWIFKMHNVQDGVTTYQDLSHHKCTDADYEQFYPTNDGSKDKL